MITPNRHYPLPNKNHDVIDDINDLRSTFAIIDDDITNTEERIEELSETVSDLENRSVHLSYAVENSEIQNISANRYLVVNSEGNGFECLDGGGDAGGKLGQCSVKKTDANFDTAWGNILEISKNGMTPQENSEISQGNETHIYADEAEIENDKQLPKVELTNYQAKSDLESTSNESVIFCDSTEEIEEQIPIATNQNFGLVKVGSGFTNDDGTISAPIITKATEDNFGIIKTGDGLVNSNGTISRDEINPATFSTFGVVKLGENLSINQSGEMEIDDMANAATIYNLGNVKICTNGIVDLEEQTLVYRLFITEDLVVQFQTHFEAQDDFSFVLELVSDGSHLIAFNENLNPQMSTLPINRGTTKLKITKKMGLPYYNVEISRLDAPEPTLLTPNYGDNVTSNLIISHNGSDHDAHNLVVAGTSNLNFFGRELYLEFGTLVVVDYVYFTSANSEALGEFYLKGSNDKTNWTTLLYKNGESISGKVYTETKGCYRYYKLYIGWKNSNYPRSIQLWGTELDNNESELVLLTPTMSSNTTAWATISYSNLHEGSAANITSETPSTYVYVKYSSTDTNDLTRWIKYEFTEPVVANFLDICSHGDNLDRSMRWYKLEGSNDDENWTLLLERQYQRNFYKYESRYHEFTNTTAYKFYKLTCLGTGTTDEYWKIGRFRLFRKDSGKHNLYNLVPKLSSNSQDGYEASSSSQYDGNHAPFYAFDGASNTKWASSGTGTQWLQIKLPTPMISNIVKIVSRTDGNYNNQVPKNFEIQGSNDAETWTTLTTQTDISWTSQGQVQTFEFENETAYQYYRLVITANGGGSDYSLGEFIIGHKVREFKRWLNKYDYLVPAMGSNSQDGYIASSNSIWGATADACKAFNRAIRGDYDNWQSGNRTNGNAECSNTWVQIKLPTAKICNFVNLVPREDYQSCKPRTPRAFTIEGSNNGSSWTVLLSVEDGGGYSGAKGWDIDNTTAYLYYRINISKTYEANQFVSIGELELFYKYIIQEY